MEELDLGRENSFSFKHSKAQYKLFEIYYAIKNLFSSIT